MAVSKTADAKKTTAQKSPEVKADAPAEKKTTGRRTAASKSEESKTTASSRKTKAGNGKLELSPEERYRMTEVAAYYLAERNGFQGHPGDYWREAEAQITQMLGR